MAYNLRGLGGPLKLGRDVLPDIFSGRIRAWNDPRIRAINPGLNLPKQNIAVVARLDGSGTTFAFTNHLARRPPRWRTEGHAAAPASTGGASPCWRQATNE